MNEQHERQAAKRKRQLKNDLLQAVAEINVLMRLIQSIPDMQANLTFPLNERDRYLDVQFRDF